MGKYAGEEENMMRQAREPQAPVPIWQKYALTLEEAAEYFGIGISKLRELS